MFVKDIEDPTLIKVLNAEDLIDPFQKEIQGKQQAGQAEQPPEAFNKERLVFPSGEPLPQCWKDPDYQSKIQ